MKNFGFNTNKKVFEDGVDAFRAKEFIFNSCTIDDMIDEFCKNGIKISRESLLEEYEKCFHLDEVLSNFRSKYKQKLQAMDNRMELFDSDVPYYLMYRLIQEHYDVDTLPDPDIIADNIFYDVEDIDEKEEPERLLNLLTAINNIRDYNKERNLQKIFDPNMIDIEDAIDKYSQLRMSKDVISKIMSKKLAIELVSLTDYYELDDNKYCYSLAMEIAGIYGFNNINNILDKAIKRYPESKLRFLVDAVTSISEKDKEHNDLMKRIKEIKPKTSEDNEYLQILYDWFN